jgi:putative sterol carrier protein
VALSTSTFIEELKKRFKKEAAQDVTATYLLSITGDNPTSILIKLDNGALSVEPVAQGSTQADCSISVGQDDFEMILDGRLSAMTAALSGIISIDGEIGMAMQLVPIFFEGTVPFV